jgi:hypothetical protein
MPSRPFLSLSEKKDYTERSVQLTTAAVAGLASHRDGPCNEAFAMQETAGQCRRCYARCADFICGLMVGLLILGSP